MATVIAILSVLILIVALVLLTFTTGIQGSEYNRLEREQNRKTLAWVEEVREASKRLGHGELTPNRFLEMMKGRDADSGTHPPKVPDGA